MDTQGTMANIREVYKCEIRKYCIESLQNAAGVAEFSSTDAPMW